MIVRMYAIIETGETKKDVIRQLEEKFGAILPSPGRCISTKRGVTKEGRLNEFDVDVDVLVESVQKQIKFEVERRLIKEKEQ